MWFYARELCAQEYLRRVFMFSGGCAPCMHGLWCMECACDMKSTSKALISETEFEKKVRVDADKAREHQPGFILPVSMAGPLLWTWDTKTPSRMLPQMLNPKPMKSWLWRETLTTSGSYNKKAKDFTKRKKRETFTGLQISGRNFLLGVSVFFSHLLHLWKHSIRTLEHHFLRT